MRFRQYHLKREQEPAVAVKISDNEPTYTVGDVLVHIVASNSRIP